MGYYCSTVIVDKKDRILHTINTVKYGIGYGRLCFEGEDYTVDVPNHIYIAKTSVKKAADRIKEVYDWVVPTMNQKIVEGMKYDEWSQKSLTKFIDFLEDLMTVLKKYPSDFVYADLSEGTYLYDKTDDILPVSDKKNQLSRIQNLLDGCFIGKYPSSALYEKAESFIKTFKEGLLTFDSVLAIDNFGTVYDPHFFILGKQQMMKFEMDVKISNESIKENYFIFDNVFDPLRLFFFQHGCDYERNFNTQYVLEDGKVRIIVYKILN